MRIKSRTDLAKIRRVATQVRKALDALASMGWPSSFVRFKEFPVGACGDASMVLARFLKEEGCGTFRYMSGSVPDGGSHGWLQRGDLIVDITADQFDQRSVTVTRFSAWHSKLETEVEDEIADYERCGFDDPTLQELREAYRLISAWLSANARPRGD